MLSTAVEPGTSWPKLLQEFAQKEQPPRSLTASLPLKSYRAPIGKECSLPFPLFFRVELLNFGGCNSFFLNDSKEELHP